MFEKVQFSHLDIGDFDFGGVVLRAQAAVDPQPGFGFGFTNEAEDGGVICQGLAGPVLADLTEDAVLNGIPFGGAGGVVADRHGQSKAVNELFLERTFPEPAPGPVAAPTVGQDQQLRGLPVTPSPLPAPPLNNGVDRKLRGVMRSANQNGAPIRL